MKILHTSDWHLGHMLYNHDRTEEQQSMLDQMVEIVAQEKPDVFILAGDVYHTSDPRPAVQTMFNKTIANLVCRCPQMTIVVTAGNHDSSTKHEIFKTPWEALNVHVIGKFDKDNLESLIVEVPNKGYVVAMPFVFERFLPEDIYERLAEMVSQRKKTDLPVVLCAHTAIKDVDVTGHDDVTEKRVGGVDIVDVSTINQGFDYVALGHIHKLQFVHTGHHNVRYCGTPLDVSFDEIYDKPHSVTIVEINHHDEKLTDDNYKYIPIKNICPLVTLPDPKDTKKFGKWADVWAQYNAYPETAKVYIRLNISDPEAMPSNAYEMCKKQAEGKEYEFCCINSPKKQATSTTENGIPQLSVEEFQKLDPWDVVKMFAADTQDASFNETEMEPLFEEALNELNYQKREEKQL